MSTVCIVQARMGSTRLPGKVLADVCGQPMIARQMARLSRSRTLDEIVVAIPDTPENDVLAALCLERRWSTFRGSEHDVLRRYLDAAEASEAGTVVRVTADCPLIDPDVMDGVLVMFVYDAPVAGRWDFVSNNLFPTWPHGLDVEAMSRNTLAIAAAKATSAFDREHVTPWITRADAGGAIFRLGNFPCPKPLGGYRLTVDYPEDLELVRRIYAHFDGRDGFHTGEVVRFLNEHPEIKALNERYTPTQQTVGNA